MKSFLFQCLLLFMSFCLMVFGQNVNTDNLIAASQSGSSPLLFSADDEAIPLVSPKGFQDERECVVRGGLPNFFGKVKQGKHLTVAYVGGSITQGDYCYRLQVSKYFENRYDNDFSWINAGVAGTGSDFGAFRLEEQVLAYHPDLVFIEFAVNGAFADGVEGIIRQIIELDPTTDICLVYTISTGQTALYQQGKIPENIKRLEKVADWYSVASVHLGMQVASLEKEGALVWKGKKTPDESRIVFSSDGLHPTTAGGNIYASSIVRALEKLSSREVPVSPHLLPEPLITSDWDSARMFKPSDIAVFDRSWKAVKTSEDDRLRKFSNWFDTVMTSDKRGSSFSFSFEGDMIGFFDIGGPEVGQLELEVDGQQLKLSRVTGIQSRISVEDPVNGRPLLNRFNAYCNNRYRGQYDLVRMDWGFHTVVVRISKEKTDKKSILGGSRQEDIQKNPRKYDQNVIYLGRILLRGTPKSAPDIFVEAESFENRGGWVIDQQFMDQMGSPYLLAHGLGEKVEDAVKEITVHKTDDYYVYARTYNWTSPWCAGEGPGKFRLRINGEPLSTVGTKGDRWMWQCLGKASLKAGTNKLVLEDLSGFDGRCDALYFTLDSDSVPPDDSVELKEFRRRKSGLPAVPVDAGDYDLVVVGGGIAGISAAVSAARLGCKVALINDRPVLGGNNSAEIRVHLGGRIESGPYKALGGLQKEFGQTHFGNAQPADNYEDDKKQAIVEREKNIVLFPNTRAVGVRMDGDRIKFVVTKNIETGKELIFESPLFSDCTGDGTVGYLSGADYMTGREAREEFGEEIAPERADKMTMGASIQWYAGKSDGPESFPVFKYGVEFNEENYERTSKGEWQWEIGMERDQIADAEYIRDYGLLVIYSNWSFIKNELRNNLSFLDQKLEWVAYIAGKRESRRLVGDYILTENDLIKGRVYDDGTAAATWTIDLHYPDPKNSAKFPGEEFKAISKQIPIKHYPIPYRCLYSRNVSNLFMAGRNISVTHVALGSVRVMRTTGMMGEVVGMAASLCKEHSVAPRGIYTDFLPELKHLMRKGVGGFGLPDNQTFNEGKTLGEPQILSLCLDGDWKFRTDVYNQGMDEKWYGTEAGRNCWDTIKVPSCWNTRLEYSGYTGAAWYSRDFTVDDIWPDKDAILRFESVYNDVQVWLNGHFLGSHDFGFAEFEFDVTDFLEERNILTLRVDNSFKIGASWNWGGIRRPVSLNIVPKRRVEDVFITAVPELNKKSAKVDARIVLKGQGASTIFIEYLNSEGNAVATQTVAVRKDDTEIRVSQLIQNSHLWNFDTPYMYRMRVRMDEISEDYKFGIRKIEVDGYKLLINGEETRLCGANYVPNDRFTGTLLPEDIYRRDIDLMKECGVNMARLSHSALPRDVLDYIDSKGILIIEEIPVWNKNDNVTTDAEVAKKWLTELIVERYNHPCIIGWSAGNEIGRLSDNPQIKGFLESAFRHIKELDSTRLAVYVTNTAAKQSDEPVLLSDIIMFNQYGSHGERADKVHETYPGKPLFYSEYGAGVNSDDINNQKIDIPSILESMRGRDYLIGASIWSFNDYRSNYKDASTMPTQNRTWGVVDAYGRKKRLFDTLQKEYSPLKVFRLAVKNGTVTVEMQTRGKYDIPSFDIRGHKLEVKSEDSTGKVIEAKSIPLPELKVGSDLRIENVEVSLNGACRVKAELVSPTGYAIHVVVNYLAKPVKPALKYAESSASAVRVYFDKPADAQECYVSACEGGKVICMTDPTIDDNILVEKLDFGKEYSFSLVAVNKAGESKPSEPLSVRTFAAELPPVLLHLRVRGENIEVGYTSSNADFIYEFEYGLSPDNLEKHVVTTEFGACNLPVIERGRPHWLRMRKRLRYGYSGQWTKTIAVN